MPQSITIGSFVLGAVLLLIAILGGKFKIFGAEVEGKTGPVPRAIAGLMGAFFIGIGLVGSMKPDAIATVSKKSGEETRTAEVPLNRPRTEVPPPKTINLGGRWRDDMGTQYVLTQNGRAFSFYALNPQNGFRSTGSGTISGHRLTSVFQTNIPSNGRGEAFISGDGSTVSGSYFDTVQGQYSLTFHRTD